MKKQLGIYEAKAQLSRVIQEVVRTGQPITVCKQGKPIVDIVPHRAIGDPLRPDPALRGARYRGDPCAPLAMNELPEVPG